MEEGSNNWQVTKDNFTATPQQPPTLEPIQWTASEFISHQKSANWYAVLGSLSVIATIIVYFITKNILSAFVVAAACLALGVLAARKPGTKQYQISSTGITIDGRLYPYSMFKAFSVIEEDAIHCIWLRQLKKFAPTVAMYFPPDQEERIIMMLDNFLPQEDRQRDLVDRLSRRIRF